MGPTWAHPLWAPRGPTHFGPRVGPPTLWSGAVAELPRSRALPPAGQPCGNLGIGKSRNLKIGKSRSLEPGNLEIWDPNKSQNKNSQNQNPFCPKCWQGLDHWENNILASFGVFAVNFVHGPEKYKFSKSKSVLPKMSARSGLVGKNPPGPIWAHLGPFFAWAGKIQKLPKFCLFSLVGPWALFTRFGALAAIHPRWGNRPCPGGMGQIWAGKDAASCRQQKALRRKCFDRPKRLNRAQWAHQGK